MSFPTYPNEDHNPFGPHEDDCPCYPRGNTPEYQYVHASGIVPDAAWNPGDGPAANGIWKLTKIDTCIWVYAGDGFLVHYLSLVGVESVCLVTLNGYNHFIAVQGPCNFHFTNQLIPGAGRKFAGGHVVVTALMENMTYSDRDLQESIGFDPAAETYFQDFPFTGKMAGHRFSRKIDNSSLHVVVDHS